MEKAEKQKITAEVTELTRKLGVMQGQFKAATGRVEELERQVVKSTTVKKDPFEPKGKFYNLVPQASSNYEIYQKLPTGVKGHMVVVLDTAFYGKTCRVWAVTVSTIHLSDM